MYCNRRHTRRDECLIIIIIIIITGVRHRPSRRAGSLLARARNDYYSRGRKISN